MNGLFLLIVFPTLWVSLSAFTLFPDRADSSTLRLVHVLFRHGNRNPDDSSLLPGNPYINESYYPEGFGQLTNAGKLTEYKIGLSLHRRYRKFLTNSWNINYVDARSTDSNRTKMSLELVLAGLYPPKGEQVWSELPWLPIPYNYRPTSEDKETYFWGACGAKFFKLFNEITSSPEATEYLQRYEELFEILKNKSGSSRIGVFDVFSYHFGFVVQEELGLPLEEWTSSIYPDLTHPAVVDFYYFITNNTEIRRLAGGYLIKKILSDTKAKIEGTLSPSSRKVFLYSGHEMNVASALLSIDAFKLTDIPPYGAHVIYEVHEIYGVWGIKLFYQNYQFINPIPLKLPGCGYFCPYDKFYSLVEEIIPESDAECTS